ncbi:uncharacterized protein G2W53_026853 [Senna tora]|uniref:Uncharacterized protein n=1 Tax=Senna tora TaxID=362788 RepID=A0A834TFR0_9FABA|nr:uncharacterized protein G2W53_026853 [Senna tora]
MSAFSYLFSWMKGWRIRLAWKSKSTSLLYRQMMFWKVYGMSIFFPRGGMVSGWLVLMGVLNRLQLCPSQLSPKSWTIIQSFCLPCEKLKVEALVVNFLETEKINISTLHLTLGIIAKGRQYGCRRLDKKSLKQRSMAREEVSQAQVAPPQFEINGGNVEVFGKEVASHPLMAEYRRLKTIMGQMQNKILQVESDDCDNESAHQAAETRERQLRQ